MSDEGQLEKAVAELQQAHKLHTQQATEKQSKLENLLTLWQRHVFTCLFVTWCVALLPKLQTRAEQKQQCFGRLISGMREICCFCSPG